MSLKMKLPKRKSEMWVSNNRVLVGGSKKITGRNPNFDADETKLLISIWGEPQVQRTLITTHKKHTVIAKLAEQMKGYGYQRSPEEINTRIKNLKCFYNRLKKDMEIGITTDPSWKHFQAMDEIMNRPIFSVRPNEVPKPSLRYRLEEEMREREERQKNGEEEESGNEFQDEMEFDDEDEKPLKIKEETATVVEGEDIIEEEAAAAAVGGVGADSDIEDVTLLIPKDEPIDVDDDDIMSEPVVKISSRPTTPQQTFLKIVSSASTVTPTARPQSTYSRIMTTIPSNVTKPSLPSPHLNLNPQIGQPMIITNPAKPTAQQPNGKISLVPTNFLLQPPQSAQPHHQQLQLRPQQQQHQQQQQHRILYTQPTSQANSSIVSGPGGMKVLLVNTMQKDNSGATVTKTVDVLNHANVSSLQNATIQTNHLQNMLNSAAAANAKTAAAAEEAKVTTHVPNEMNGLRTLLNHLINLQTDTNELERKRLDLEKERFEFEKSMAERFFGALPAFLQNVQPPATATPKNHIQISPKFDEGSITAVKVPIGKIANVVNEEAEHEPRPDSNCTDEADFTGFQLVTPKIEVDD